MAGWRRLQAELPNSEVMETANCSKKPWLGLIWLWWELARFVPTAVAV